MIQFKWEKYGKAHHMVGFLMHIFNCFIIILYVSNSYIVESDNQYVFAVALGVGIIYPSLYDLIQLWKSGAKEYF